MNRADISKVVSGISTRHIQEAESYLADTKEGIFKNGISKNGIFKKKILFKGAVAAVFAFCFLAIGFKMYQISQDTGIRAYAYGTDDEITKAGAVLQTGTISDDGEMKGTPLMFYLIGNGIENVRFSCKNQQLQFRDWTQKRDEFGLAQNFTVPYGEKEDDYGYLTIDWEPDSIIQALMENEHGSIQDLPSDLREDLIVMQITFIDGKTAVKAISISLQTDGKFFAKLSDYQISDADTFVNRNDALTLRQLSQIKRAEIESEIESKASDQTDQDGKKEDEDPSDSMISDAMKAAKEYYANTVFEVLSMEVLSKEKISKKTPGESTLFNETLKNETIKNEALKNEALKSEETDQMKFKITFSVCASIDGIIQEPNRKITLKQKKGTWEVISEGY